MPLRFATVALLSLAAGWATGASTPMGYDDARHLLARTGFGPTDAEVQRFAGLTREQAVTQLLRDARSSAVTPPPLWTDDDAALRYPNPRLRLSMSAGTSGNGRFGRDWSCVRGG